ncbi:MAG TPA: MFS transporter, partial [Prevotella sp.]
MNFRTPLAWVPTLYFSKGLSHVILMTVAVVVYIQLGLSDTEVAFYTAWLALPWVLKPLLIQFTRLYQTKRWWILTMQLLMGSALAGVAFTIRGSQWLQSTLFFLMLFAFSSATQDSVLDFYYKRRLDAYDRSRLAGIRYIFYHLSYILGKGMLVPVAGILQVIYRNQKIYTWSLVFYALAGIFMAIWLYHFAVLPRSVAVGEMRNFSFRAILGNVYSMFRAFFSK